MKYTTLAIDIIKTEEGFHVLYGDEILEDDNGVEVFKTFKEAVKLLQLQLSCE